MNYCYIADRYKRAVAELGLIEPADWMRYAVEDMVVDRTTETRRGGVCQLVPAQCSAACVRPEKTNTQNRRPSSANSSKRIETLSTDSSGERCVSSYMQIDIERL